MVRSRWSRRVRVFTAGLPAVLLLALASVAAAQRPDGAPVMAAGGQIRGVVVDSGNARALSGAAVSVHAARDSALIAGAISDASGRFRIEGLMPEKYVVRVSFMGYAPAVRPAAITLAAPVVDLGTVRLVAAPVELDEVRVEAQRSAVTLQIDRTIYNTRDMPVAAGGTAADVLRNVPELEVDLEGNVKLLGSQSVAIYINGRPAPMRGDALRTFIQQLQANRVDRIEVIPNPSAKYDPRGMAGIVDIVLAENVDLGVTGNVNVGGDSRGAYSGYGSMTYQRGRLSLFGGGGVNLYARDDRVVDLRENRLADPITYLDLESTSETDGLFSNANLSAQWRVGARSTLHGAVRYFGSTNESNRFADYTILDAGRLAIQHWDQDNDSRSTSGSTDVSVGYRRVVVPMRDQLSIELRRNSSGFGSASDYVNRYFAPDGSAPDRPDEIGDSDSDSDREEWSLQADLTRPVGASGRLEAGYRGSIEESDQTSGLVRRLATDPDPTSTTNSGYDHLERSHQVYVTMAGQLGPVGISAGGRAENVHAEFTMRGRPTDSQDYTNFYPSLGLSVGSRDGALARLSYSRRVERPTPRHLNAFVPSTDSLNRTAGNPDLEPKYTHSVYFDLSRTTRFGMLRFAPYYRITTNNWDRFKIVDTAGVATLTWRNTKAAQSYGGSLSASLRWGERANGFINLNAYRFQLDAGNLSTAYSADGVRWDLSLNGTAALMRGLDLQTMIRYSAPQDMPQGRIGSTLMSNIGARQRLFGNKAWLNLYINDPFDIYRFEFETRDGTHAQTSRTRLSMRTVRLNFSYAFGQTRDLRPRESDEDQQRRVEPPPMEIH